MFVFQSVKHRDKDVQLKKRVIRFQNYIYSTEDRSIADELRKKLNPQDIIERTGGIPILAPVVQTVRDAMPNIPEEKKDESTS